MDPSLKRLFVRIEPLRRRLQNETPSDRQYEQWVFERGISHGDWKLMQEQFAAIMSRARGFLQYNVPKDALLELEHALLLQPNHSDLQACMGQAYWQLWNIERNERHLEAARRHLNRCLSLEPHHRTARELQDQIGRVPLHTPSTRSSGNRNQALTFAVLAGILFLSIAGLVFLSLVGEAPKSDEWDRPETRIAEPITTNSNMKNPNPITDNPQGGDKRQPGVVIENKGAEIRVSPGTDIIETRSLEIRYLSAERYPEFAFEPLFALAHINHISDNYTDRAECVAYIKVGKVEWNKTFSTKVKARLLDEQGKVLARGEFAQSSLETVRPGDDFPISIDFFSNPAINTLPKVEPEALRRAKTIEIEIDKAQTRPPAATYPQERPIEIIGNLAKSVRLMERQSKIEFNDISKQHLHSLNYTISHSESAPIKQLVGKVRWYAEDGSMLGEYRQYFVSSTPLYPNKRVPAFMVYATGITAPNARVARYTVEFTDVQYGKTVH